MYIVFRQPGNEHISNVCQLLLSGHSTTGNTALRYITENLTTKPNNPITCNNANHTKHSDNIGSCKPLMDWTSSCWLGASQIQILSFYSNSLVPSLPLHCSRATPVMFCYLALQAPCNKPQPSYSISIVQQCILFKCIHC